MQVCKLIDRIIRRTKAHLSMCYKIINNHTGTQFASSFTFSLSSKTRGNSRKLDKSHVSTVCNS